MERKYIKLTNHTAKSQGHRGRLVPNFSAARFRTKNKCSAKTVEFDFPCESFQFGKGELSQEQ